MISLQCLILLGTVCCVSAMTCNQCFITYENSKKQPRKSDTDKCNYMKTYVGCLFNAGCVSTPQSVANLVADYRKFNMCSGTISGVCKCQLDYYTSTHSNWALNTRCAGLLTHQLNFCPKTTEGASCDGRIRDGEQYYSLLLGQLESYNCIVGSTCGCEIKLNKAPKNCPTYLNSMSCFASATTISCDGKTAKDQLAEDVENKMKSSCSDPSEACQCEVDAAVSPTTSYTSTCSTLHTLYDCLNDLYNENTTHFVCNNEDSDKRAKEVRIVGGLNLCLFSISSAVCINTYIPLLVMSLVVGLKLSV